MITLAALFLIFALVAALYGFSAITGSAANTTASASLLFAAAVFLAVALPFRGASRRPVGHHS